MRVAVLLENRPEFFAIFVALNRLGVSIVPVNPELRAAELAYLIGHSEPALVIAIENRQQALRTAADAAGVALSVIGPTDSPPAPRANAVVADDAKGDACEAAVLYTSGTTGNPKGCVLPNSYFLLAGRWYAELGGIVNLQDSGERMITPLPIFHMNAMAYSFMAMVTVGGCLIALDRFHPRTWWKDVASSGATCLHYLGVMPSILMSLERSDQDNQHNIRFGFGAGAPCGWVAARVVNDEGEDAAPNEPGELWVRNAGDDPRYGFFSHYYKNPQATDEAWQGGWFHTGDIVKYDADGQYFFVDRKKNVIRRSGENIAAVEVESVLMRHPLISAAGVTAVPDKVRGDEVFACLQVEDASENLANEITKWALVQMAYYKVPGHIAFVDSLPLTPTQKIQRKALKEKAIELLEDPATINCTHLKKRQTV